MSKNICERLKLPWNKPDLSKWEDLISRHKKIKNTEKVRIGLVGKYTKLGDAYLSVIKAIESAALEALVNVSIIFIESTHLEE